MSFIVRIQSAIAAQKELAMRISTFESLGYQKVDVSKLDYHYDLTEKEESFIKAYNKHHLLQLIPAAMIIMFFCSLIIPSVISMRLHPSQDKEVLIFPFIIMGLLAVLVVVVPLINVCGKKKAAQATVIGTRQHTRHGRRHTHTTYYAVVYQSSPSLVYANNVKISRQTYTELMPEDTVTIIKTAYGNYGYHN